MNVHDAVEARPQEQERRAREYLDGKGRTDLFVPGMTWKDADDAFEACPQEQERYAREYLDDMAVDEFCKEECRRMGVPESTSRDVLIDLLRSELYLPPLAPASSPILVNAWNLDAPMQGLDWVQESLQVDGDGDFAHDFITADAPPPPLGSKPPILPAMNEECNICMDTDAPMDVRDPSTYVVACSSRHIFHRNCLRTLYNSGHAYARRCPDCRGELIPSAIAILNGWDELPETDTILELERLGRLVKDRGLLIDWQEPPLPFDVERQRISVLAKRLAHAVHGEVQASDPASPGEEERASLRRRLVLLYEGMGPVLRAIYDTESEPSTGLRVVGGLTPEEALAWTNEQTLPDYDTMAMHMLDDHGWYLTREGVVLDVIVSNEKHSDLTMRSTRGNRVFYYVDR